MQSECKLWTLRVISFTFSLILLPSFSGDMNYDTIAVGLGMVGTVCRMCTLWDNYAGSFIRLHSNDSVEWPRSPNRVHRFEENDCLQPEIPYSPGVCKFPFWIWKGRDEVKKQNTFLWISLPSDRISCWATIEKRRNGESNSNENIARNEHVDEFAFNLHFNYFEFCLRTKQMCAKISGFRIVFFFRSQPSK